MKLEVLHVVDCPNLSPMLERLGEVTDLPVTAREIGSDAEAAEFGMAGSPTLLIDGVDPFSAPGRCDCGVSCRLYRDDNGRIVPAPSAGQLRAAIAASGQDRPAAARDPAAAAEVLSAWRTRGLPLDPVEKAVHQAILGTFATTGRPPSSGDLDSVTAGSGRNGADSAVNLRPGSHRMEDRCVSTNRPTATTPAPRWPPSDSCCCRWPAAACRS